MNGVKNPSIKNSNHGKKFIFDKKNRKLMQKNAEISEKTRKEGNKLFGQKSHNKELHKTILSTYSKSIAYALEKSHELAAAYNNRSVLLMHIGRYEESLVDIDRALEIAKSEELLLKLVARRAKIVNSNELLMKALNLKDDKHQALNKQKNNDKFSITKPSTMMPCASESVILKYDKTFGRHFIAAKDIKPGEVIVVEDGYICIPKNNLRYFLCTHCLLFTWNGIPCDSCPFVVYCSEDCKKEAWQDYHDIECRIFPYLDFMISDENGCVMADIAIALRIFLKAVKKEGLDAVLNDAETLNTEKDNEIKGLLTEGILQNDKFRACYNLADNVQYTAEAYQMGDHNIQQLVNLFLLKTNILDAKKNSQNAVTITLVNQLIMILNKIRHIAHVNAFSYQGSICECPDLDEPECNCGSNRGIIIAPCCSLINHSCCANVSRLFLPKKKVVLFTLTHVKKGDQLCDSYGASIRLEKKRRQKMLQQNFYFTCMCKACTENWPHLAKLRLLINIKTETNIICQVIYAFKKSYPKESELFIFQDPENLWGINKEGLEKAKLTSELIYKYSNDYMKTFILCYPYRTYIDKILFNLYGEKCDMPDVCA